MRAACLALFTPFLRLQQLLLPFHAAPIAPQRAVGADDAVAWDDQHHGIGRAGPGDRARRPRLADSPGYFLVAPRLAVRNPPQLFPDAALKRRAANIERQVR